MSWVVKDTSLLKDYGFRLEEVYDEEPRITAWQYDIPFSPFEKIWIEVMENDVLEETDEVIEIKHEVELMRASAFSIDECWEFFLPKLAELYNDGVIEWSSENE